MTSTCAESPVVREGAAVVTQYAPWPEVEAPLVEAIEREQDRDTKEIFEIALNSLQLNPEATAGA